MHSNVLILIMHKLIMHKKNLPRPGVEPKSLRPQRNVLTVRPPKHPIFIVQFFTELLGLVTVRNSRVHIVVCMVAKYERQ